MHGTLAWVFTGLFEAHTHTHTYGLLSSSSFSTAQAVKVELWKYMTYKNMKDSISASISYKVFESLYMYTSKDEI